ncbi:MAG: anthranilate synthase component I family protein [Sedimentisphaerales bacterium]|nr:anthranilate synthase component I family protein [Sedimentisphaerales bacterium]
MITNTLITENQNILCKLHYRNISEQANLPALNKLFSELESASILGANSSITEAGRYSYWAAQPKEIFEFKSGQSNPFDKLQKILSKYQLDKDSTPLLPENIFCGGWIGFFSYELNRYIEKIPVTTTDDLTMPLIRLCFYDSVIAYDHREKHFWLFALDIQGDVEGPEQKLDALEELISKSQKITIPPSVSESSEHADFSKIQCNMNKEYYMYTFEKIIKYIFDGDVYQINFSRRFEYEFNADAIELFNWQNQHNPSPYSAYIDSSDLKIVSASPEMFITIDNGIISTKPIKGTRPRIENSDIDYASQLLHNEKEQAELNMIIDLERNDVAKICVPGTRKVTQSRTIETYPTVYHAVATVSGQLRENISFCDILKAMFPGGSITGAPKIRSMEIIDETEPTARGVYTGSIGFIGLNGNTSFNIAIRTIIIKNNKAYFQSGGGIVADSQPESEWEETIIKAKALLAGIKNITKVL